MLIVRCRTLCSKLCSVISWCVGYEKKPAS
jgi:hypothetical protein